MATSAELNSELEYVRFVGATKAKPEKVGKLLVVLGSSSLVDGLRGVVGEVLPERDAKAMLTVLRVDEHIGLELARWNAIEILDDPKIGAPGTLRDAGGWEESRLGEIAEALADDTGAKTSIDDPPWRTRYLAELKRVVEHSTVAYAGLVAHVPAIPEVYVSRHITRAVSVRMEAGWLAEWALSVLPIESDSYRGDPGDLLAPVDISRGERKVVEGLLVQIESDMADDRDPDTSPVRSRPLPLSRPSTDGIKWAVHPVTVEEYVRFHDKLVLLGGPGSGKSTVARAMLLEPADDYLPVFVELRDFVASEHFPRGAKKPTAASIFGYLADQYLANSPADRRALRTALRREKTFWVLDGLDEVPLSVGRDTGSVRQEQMRALVAEIVRSSDVRRIVVTSRPYGYDGWRLTGFAEARLAGLREADIELIAKAYWDAVAPPSAQMGDFLKQLSDLPEDLRSTPLMVHLMASVYLRDDSEGLPRTRPALLRQAVVTLIDSWASESVDTPPAEELLERLAAVAYRTHEQADPTERVTAIPSDVLIEELWPIEAMDVKELAGHLSHRANVLVSPGGTRFEFAHRGFQEFLAATHLTANDEGPTAFAQHFVADPDLWAEPGTMLAEALVSDGRLNALWDYAEALVERDEAAATHPHAIWMAATLVARNTDPASWSRLRNAALVQRVRELAAEILQRPGGSLGPLRLVGLGTALARLGDPRHGVGLRDGKVDIEWCRVPGGTHTIGLNHAMKRLLTTIAPSAGTTYERETPAHSVELPDFLIARYPVTCSQWHCFVREAYMDDRWWAEPNLGRDFRRWAAVTDSVPTAPQTGVTWYEARAFARWLSHETGSKVRLPTEVEWEAAARAPDDRLFPWGNDPDGNRLNSVTAGFGRAVPVGVIGNNAPCPGGPRDMAGNVWEWCSTADTGPDDSVFSYPYTADDREAALDETCLRIVRGGSYTNAIAICRNTFRGRDLPTARFSRQGFRLVRDISQ